MKTYITINNRRYEAKDFTYNLVCDLDEMGFHIQDDSFQKMNLSLVRAYAALCMGVDKDTAGDELSEDFDLNKFNEINQIMLQKVQESPFFQALSKGTEEENPEVQTKENPENKSGK